jgi:hypothetical protein
VGLLRDCRSDRPLSFYRPSGATCAIASTQGSCKPSLLPARLVETWGRSSIGHGHVYPRACKSIAQDSKIADRCRLLPLEICLRCACALRRSYCVETVRLPNKSLYCIARERPRPHHPFHTPARSLGWSRIEAVRVACAEVSECVLSADVTEAKRTQTGDLLIGATVSVRVMRGERQNSSTELKAVEPPLMYIIIMFCYRAFLHYIWVICTTRIYLAP